MKIIQIAVIPDEDSSILYALCDDGTLWHGEWIAGDLDWHKLITPDTQDDKD